VRASGHDRDLLTFLRTGDEAHLEADPGEPQDVGRRTAGEVGRARDLDVVRTEPDLAELGDLTEEAHDEVVRRRVVERVRRTDLLDASVVDDHDLVGDLHRLLLVVGDEHRRHRHLVVEPAQPVA
jgi:hypothetical protein